MLGSVTYTVTRRAGVFGTDGEYTPGATSTLSVSGSLQPLTAREIEALPEGLRQRARFVLLVGRTGTRLQVAGTSGVLGDRVSVSGEALEVHGFSAFDQENTPKFALAHRSYILVSPERPHGS